MLPIAILLSFLQLCFSADDVTFKNVTFRGYKWSNETFKTISSSNSLKENLLGSDINRIEIYKQYVPVIRENSLANLENIEELIIEICEVTKIQPGALKNVPLLKYLSLSGNRLEEIDEGVFNNLSITRLDLSSNSISDIDNFAFEDLPNLSEINLAHNNIGAWNPYWFTNVPNLITLNLHHNSIGWLPREAFKNLEGHSVRSYGRVDVDIILSYNKITQIVPGAFNGLDRINNLWLDNNKVGHFDPNLLDDIEVKSLKLNNNNLRCLRGDLGKIIKASYTDLDLNPFKCECLDKIKTWVKQNGNNVKLLNSKLDCD